MNQPSGSGTASLDGISSPRQYCAGWVPDRKGVFRIREVSEETSIRHEAFILNSILSSVAFLESIINEVNSDAVDKAYIFYDDKNEIS